MPHFQHILKGVLSQSSGLDADLVIYLGSLTTPLSAGQQTLLNTFITSLKTGLGITTLAQAFDVMYILANETSEAGLKNLVKRLHDSTTTGSPAFVQFEGFTGGTGKFINTNYNANTEGSNSTLNNSSFGCYVRTNIAGDLTDIGVRDSAAIVQIVSRSSGNLFIGRLYNGVYPLIDKYNLNSSGMYIITRNAASHLGLFGFKNKIKYTVTATTGDTNNIPSHNYYILGRNNAGTLDQPSTRQVSFAFVGRHLSDAEQGILYDSFQAYMTALGKQV